MNMGTYIKEIARRLKANEPIIFYTVGSGTFESIRALKANMTCGQLRSAMETTGSREIPIEGWMG